MKQLMAVILLVLVLSGCKGTVDTSIHPEAPADSVPVSTELQFETHSDRRFGYELSFPSGWSGAAPPVGDEVEFSPRGNWMQPDSPGIRLFISVRDEAKHMNLSPTPPEWLIGKGGWPYMAVSSAEEVQVPTATGPAQGYRLKGAGEAKGVRYAGVGLYVYGTGHSYRLYCTAPEAEWPKWESMCQQVIQTFKGGDMSKMPGQPAETAQALLLMRGR